MQADKSLMMLRALSSSRQQSFLLLLSICERDAKVSVPGSTAEYL